MAIERRAWAVDPDGERSLVRCIISEPSTDRLGNLYVSLCLLGLDRLSHTIGAADHWQAVDLAMLTARERIEHFSDLGWRFYWEKELPEDTEFEMFPEDIRDGLSEA